MNIMKNVGRELTREELSRPLMVNNVIVSLGHFFYLNDPALWPPDDVAAVLALKPGERRTFGGGAFAEFDVERID